MQLRLGRPLQAWRARRLQRSLAGPKLLDAFGASFPAAFFIEIGSNDGEQHDHLRPLILRRSWSGIMVEPVPYVFERLRSNYGGLERIVLENSAIAGRDGSLPFFHLAEALSAQERARLPGWYDAIGSFSRDLVLDHAREIPDIESRLVETEVPCMTFESLCRKHRVEAIDLLLTDAEGHDAEILRTIDLSAWQPRLVLYEHYHLTRREQADCRERVEAAGYETIEEGFDTWCLDTEPDDQLTRTWRKLRPGVPGVFSHQEDR